MGKIIGFCNQKGGTAKTTSAVNISAFLGLMGQKTLIVDMDPQANTTSGLGCEKSDKPTIYDFLMKKTRAEESIFPTKWTNLDVIQGNIALTGGEIELVEKENREAQLKERMDELRDKYEYIIIDAPPSLSLLTLNVLVAVDSLIVPIQCEYFALEGVSKLLNTVDLVSKNLNRNLEIEGILLTMADFRTRLTLQVIDEVRHYFKEKVFNTVIPRNIKLAEAPSFGKPIMYYDKECIGAKAYAGVTGELLKQKIEYNKIKGI